MDIWAHRGASADAPENTLAAFAEAVTQGADGIELDVMLCGSGELVVCHDERLDRLAGVLNEVARTPWRRLRTFDVGTRLGFGTARIPLLEEVLDAVPETMQVNVELKCEAVDDMGLARRVGELLVEREEEHRVVVSSFNAGCLFRLAAAFPSLRRGQLMDPDRRYGPQVLLTPFLAGYSVHPDWRWCTVERVALWHARGLRVATWTVDDPVQARLLASVGVDIAMTNRPRALREALALPAQRVGGGKTRKPQGV